MTTRSWAALTLLTTGACQGGGRDDEDDLGCEETSLPVPDVCNGDEGFRLWGAQGGGALEVTTPFLQPWGYSGLYITGSCQWYAVHFDPAKGLYTPVRTGEFTPEQMGQVAARQHRHGNGAPMRSNAGSRGYRLGEDLAPGGDACSGVRGDARSTSWSAGSGHGAPARSGALATRSGARPPRSNRHPRRLFQNVLRCFSTDTPKTSFARARPSPPVFGYG